MSKTLEYCNGFCHKEFLHGEEAYLFDDAGIVLCPTCMAEVKERLSKQGKLEGARELVERFSEHLDFKDTYSQIDKNDILIGYKWLMWLKSELSKSEGEKP